MRPGRRARLDDHGDQHEERVHPESSGGAVRIDVIDLVGVQVRVP